MFLEACSKLDANAILIESAVKLWFMRLRFMSKHLVTGYAGVAQIELQQACHLLLHAVQSPPLSAVLSNRQHKLHP